MTDNEQIDGTTDVQDEVHESIVSPTLAPLDSTKMSIQLTAPDDSGQDDEPNLTSVSTLTTTTSATATSRLGGLHSHSPSIASESSISSANGIASGTTSYSRQRLHSHSPQPSITQFAPPSPSRAASDPISWSKLRKLSNQLYSSANFAKYGKPQCIYAGSTIVVGTAHGYVLVFDYQQDLKVAFHGHRNQTFGQVTCLSLSADQTAVAAGHSLGDIVVWDLVKKSVLMHVKPAAESKSSSVDSDVPSKHIRGSPIIHVGFVDKRHTAVVASDTLGYVFYHESVRSFDGKSTTSRRILGKRRDEQNASKAIVLSMAYRSLGPIPQKMDELGLVALITPYMIVVVSTFPQIRTHWRSSRPRHMDLSMGLTASLAWYPNQTRTGSKLAYCWSNVICVVEVDQILQRSSHSDTEIELRFTANKRYICDESVVALQWLNTELLALVTITQRLIIINAEAMATCTSIDILNRHLMHYDIFSSQVVLDNKPVPVADAYFNSVKTFKGRLFLLGKYELVMGTLTNWADRLLDIMNSGDHVLAIQQMTAFFEGTGDMALSGLPSNDDERHAIVIRSLPDMLIGCLNYTMHSTDIDKETVSSVLNGCLKAILAISDTQYVDKGQDLLALVYENLESSPSRDQFFEQLIPLIQGNYIKALPPALYRDLIIYCGTTDPPLLESIICRVDTMTLDLDLAFSQCSKYNLRDTRFYIQNQMLQDFKSPLQELLKDPSPSQSLYDYLDDILSGRMYPLGQTSPYKLAQAGKESVYSVILGEGVLWQLIEGDPLRFFAVLDTAFEDLFLNEHPQYNRQTIINHLLEFRAGSGDSTGMPLANYYLDIFLANNYSKYPQFIILTGKTLQELLTNISFFPADGNVDESRRELALCSILSRFKPSDLDEVISMFFSQKLYSVLQYVFRTEQKFDRVLNVVLLERLELGRPPVDDLFDVVDLCLKSTLRKSQQQRYAVKCQIEENFGMLAELSCDRLVDIVSQYDKSLHELSLKLTPSALQFEYLHALFSHGFKAPPSSSTVDSGGASVLSSEIRHTYVSALCQKGLIVSLYDLLKNTLTSKKDVELPNVVDDLIEAGAIDSLVLLLLRNDRINEAMIYLRDKLLDLGAIMGTSKEGQEEEEHPNNEDLFHELHRYVKIGIEVCRAQNNYRESEGLWIGLISTVMDVSDSLTSASRHLLLQEVVSALLNTKTFFGQTNVQHDQSVIKILKAVLLPTKRSGEGQSKGPGRTIGVTRPFIEDLFTAYRYQYNMLTIFQGLMNADTYHNLMQLVCERESGWRVSKTGECEGCGEKVVGVGIDAEKLYTQWQQRSKSLARPEKLSHVEARAQVTQSQKDDAMLAVFKCGHTYHVGCLRRLGSLNMQCIVCD